MGVKFMEVGKNEKKKIDDERKRNKMKERDGRNE